MTPSPLVYVSGTRRPRLGHKSQNRQDGPPIRRSRGKRVIHLNGNNATLVVKRCQGTVALSLAINSNVANTSTVRLQMYVHAKPLPVDLAFSARSGLGGSLVHANNNKAALKGTFIVRL